MKILVLTLSTGQGHNQTAASISEYFINRGHESVVLDVYKYISPFLSDSVEKGYLVSTSHIPRIYGKLYRFAEISDEKEIPNPLYRLFNSVLGIKFAKYVSEYKPDVIITTHVFAALMMLAMEDKMPESKTVGIITDFTVHPFWGDTDLDYYVTASHLLSHACIKKGIDAEKILPFGIPIHEKFTKSMPKAEAREKLGMENRDTVMVMMGSMGFGNVYNIVKKIDSLDLDFQIICVCGKNKKAQKKIENIKNANHKIYCHGFVDNVDVMMDAADFIVTKPGGLTSSECLAKGLPMMLLNPIPGQEDRNMEFLTNNGLAMKITSTYPVDEAIYQFFSNEKRRETLGQSIKYLGKPESTKTLGEFVLRLGNEN